MRTGLLWVWVSLVTMILLILSCGATEHVCGHEDLMAAHPHYPTVASDTALSLLQEGEDPSPIRIHVDYSTLDTDGGRTCYAAGQRYTLGTPAPGAICAENGGYTSNCEGTCSSEQVLTHQKKLLLVNELVPEALSLLSKVLRVVRPVREGLRINAKCGFNGEFPVPSQYRDGSMKDADVVVFVTARPTFGAQLAWAGPCHLAEDGRPLAVHVNVGTKKLSKSDIPLLEQTVVHELLHGFGFGSSTFPYFVDANGQPLCPPSAPGKRPTLCDRVVRTVVRRDNGAERKVALVVTPRVVDEGQRHFACPSLDGVELENEGGALTAGGHWEARVLGNEIMCGRFQKSWGLAPFSAFTMALLDDTGWYKTDRQYAQKLAWGNRMGCSFVHESCANWPDDMVCIENVNGRRVMRQPIGGNGGFKYCSTDRTAKADCPVGRARTALSPFFQYFDDDPLRIGLTPNFDYCPIYIPYSNANCLLKEHGKDSPLPWEHYGMDARCIEATMQYCQKAYGQVSCGEAVSGPFCMRHKCTPSGLWFRPENCDCKGDPDVPEQCACWVACPRNGGEVSFDVSNYGVKSSFICPPFKFCGDNEPTHCPKDCGGHGVCDAGMCECEEGWRGVTCETKRCPNDCSEEGTCKSDGTCECRPGWGGPDCSKKMGLTLECPLNCNGHGTCDEGTGKCSCVSGWTGAGCNVRTVGVDDPLEAAGIDGTAEIAEPIGPDLKTDGDAPTTTDAEWPWIPLSAAPSPTPYPGIALPLCHSDNDNSCNDETLPPCGLVDDTQPPILPCKNNCARGGVKRGRCDTTTGHCHCFRGFTGEDCSDLECPSDCNGRGECDPLTGQCQCFVGFTGPACEALIDGYCNSDKLFQMVQSLYPHLRRRARDGEEAVRFLERIGWCPELLPYLRTYIDEFWSHKTDERAAIPPDDDPLVAQGQPVPVHAV